MNEQTLRCKIIDFLTKDPAKTRFVAEAIFFYSKVTLQAKDEIKDYVVEQDVENWIKSAQDFIQMIEAEQAKNN